MVEVSGQVEQVEGEVVPVVELAVGVVPVVELAVG